MFPKLIIAAILICVLLAFYAVFFRKKELNVILSYVKTIHENIVSLGETAFFVSSTLDSRFSKKSNFHHYISVSVYDERPSYDTDLTKSLNILTEPSKVKSYTYSHELILNKRMTFIERFVLLWQCYFKLKKLYPEDQIVLVGFPAIYIHINDAEIALQKEKIRSFKLESLLKKYESRLSAYQDKNYLPPWIIDESVAAVKQIGYGQEEAQKAIVDLMLKLGLDVDLEYKIYTIPKTLSQADFDSALLNCQVDASKNGVPIDDIVAFRMRCLPGETAENAKVAIVASKILANRG